MNHIHSCRARIQITVLLETEKAGQCAPNFKDILPVLDLTEGNKGFYGLIAMAEPGIERSKMPVPMEVKGILD